MKPLLHLGVCVCVCVIISSRPKIPLLFCFATLDGVGQFSFASAEKIMLSLASIS